MMLDERSKIPDWLMIMIIAFGGGIVSNIIRPTRRGVLGFLSAAIISVFCGGLAGLIGTAFNIHSGWCFMICGTCAVMGDRFLTAVLSERERQVYNFNGPIDNNTIQSGENNHVNRPKL